MQPQIIMVCAVASAQCWHGFVLLELEMACISVMCDRMLHLAVAMLEEYGPLVLRAMET
jgi:hypothetical protein